MKIKCPACQTVLQIPDTAAGKVVKCQCGKQMRAPGGPAKSAPAPQAPRPQAPAAQRPTPQSPGPAQTASGGYVSPFAQPPQQASGGILDELTDTDLAPVKAVTMPGAKAPVQKHGAATEKLLREASGNSDRRAEGMLASGEAPRPGLLTFIGVVNGFWGFIAIGLLLLFVGVVGMVEALEGQIPGAAEGVAFFLITGALSVGAITSFATCIACFTRGAVSWYIVLFSYGWGLADRIFQAIQLLMEGENAGLVGKGIGILIGIGVWAWLHGEEVRAFYGTDSEKVWKIVVADVAGFICAGALWGAIMALGA